MVKSGFHNENKVLRFFATSEGYVDINVVEERISYMYVYNYTDHLGNIRLSYTNGPEDVARILEENHHYPFGLKHKGYNEIPPSSDNLIISYQYKYQSQELQDELGLNWYSFKWRNYMPDIGRFFNIDPFAEQYNYQSPYNFAENKVVSHFELEGLEAVLAITLGKGVKYRGNILQQAYSDAQHTNIQSGEVNSFVDAFRIASASDSNSIGFISI